MISGEQKFVSIEQDGVAASVTRRRDRKQVISKLDGFLPGQHAFDAGSRTRHVVAMQDAFGAEMIRPLLVVGDIIAMGQEHQLNPAELFDVFHQRAGESRRVDQDVPPGPDDQIARCSIRRLGSESAKVDSFIDQLRIGFHSQFRGLMAGGPYRSSRAGDQGLERREFLQSGLGLMMNHRLIADVGESLGRNLAAQVAVDTGRIDEKVPWDVLRMLELE